MSEGLFGKFSKLDLDLRMAKRLVGMLPEDDQAKVKMLRAALEEMLRMDEQLAAIAITITSLEITKAERERQGFGAPCADGRGR